MAVESSPLECGSCPRLDRLEGCVGLLTSIDMPLFTQHLSGYHPGDFVDCGLLQLLRRLDFLFHVTLSSVDCAWALVK